MNSQGYRNLWASPWSKAILVVSLLGLVVLTGILLPKFVSAQAPEDTEKAVAKAVASDEPRRAATYSPPMVPTSRFSANDLRICREAKFALEVGDRNAFRTAMAKMAGLADDRDLSDLAIALITESMSSAVLYGESFNECVGDSEAQLAPADENLPPQYTSFTNCTEARDAGAAPVYRGSAGYGTHLDRDGDGVGCE